MSDDANDPTGTTPEGADGSADEGQTTQEPKGLTPEEQIASYRKRQAGAEAARQAAEARAAAAEAEAAKYRALVQTEEQKGLSELEATKAMLAAEKRRADEAEERATARVLDAKFPNARKELPEVTDEVKLARFEAMLADAEPAVEQEPPTPRAHNAAKPTTPEPAKKKTLAEMEAEVLATPVPEGWL